MDGDGTMGFGHGEGWEGSWRNGSWVDGTKYNKDEVPADIRLLFEKR